MVGDLYSTIGDSILNHLLYIAAQHPAMLWARQGRSVEILQQCCCRCFFNPSVLRTPPLYFAVQNTGEEGSTGFENEVGYSFFSLLFCSTP